MDKITEKVREMYSKYPYPSPSSNALQTNELLNLLKIFSLENNYVMSNKKILDAGTGTGHRLINTAKNFQNNTFIGVDLSNKSLKIAKRLCKDNNLTNIEFRITNIMEELTELGKFDLILCMGVLHHLSNPKKGLNNLINILKENGIIFLYLYGKLGGHERMIKKKIISLLMGNNINYNKGIKIARKLNFNDFEYGWNIKAKNSNEENSLITDAYLNPNEKLYDFEDIKTLLKDSGLYGFSIYGISTGKQGLLFDTRTKQKGRLQIPQTNINNIIKSREILKFYDSLSIENKYNVLDLFYEPNGYTIIGFTKTSYNLFSEKSRILNNFIHL